MNGHACITIKLDFGALKFEFHVIVTSQNILLLIFLKLLKNIKTTRSSCAIQKQVVGPIQSMGHTLLTPGAAHSVTNIENELPLITF